MKKPPLIFAALLSALLGSCGGGRPRGDGIPATFTASGRIDIDSEEARTLALEFVPTGGGEAVRATVDAGSLTYSAELPTGAEYAARLVNADGWRISGGGTISARGAEVGTANIVLLDIRAERLPLHVVAGRFVGRNEEIPSKIEFVDMDGGRRHEGQILAESGEYVAHLRDGRYEIVAETENAESRSHVVVDGSGVEKDVNLVAKEAERPRPFPRGRPLTVGRSADFRTVGAALAAVRAYPPKSEEERVTISVQPGVYREQLDVDVPFVTLKNAGGGEVRLTWYYGAGALYHSAGENGRFDGILALDRFGKNPASAWGCTVLVKKSARAFRAEGITFENSFGRRVEGAETADGAEADGRPRRPETDAESRSESRPCAALVVEADETEFLGCRFLGSQATLGTGGGIRGYLRACLVEGQIDLIFGGGSFVFEECELRWRGFSDSAEAGFATAARTALEERGWLFENCLISRADGADCAGGFFGRPWGADATVAFVGTLLETEDAIDGAGWARLSVNDPADANFREHGTTFRGFVWRGDGLDLGGRVAGTVVAAGGNVPEELTADYVLEGWPPAFAEAREDAKARLTKPPKLVSDGSLKKPRPGDTLTVAYSIPGARPHEDTSRIEWLRLRGGTLTTVRQSAGFGRRTYRLTDEDIGARIEAVVTPQLHGGAFGERKSARLPSPVADPAKADAPAKRRR